MCAISCAGMQLKAEKDAKFELVLETWVRLKLLFGSIVRFCARLTRLTYFLLHKKTLMLYVCDEMLDQNLSIYMSWFIS